MALKTERPAAEGEDGVVDADVVVEVVVDVELVVDVEFVGVGEVEDVDELALRAALAAVVAHHDAVRMRYERVDRVWRQTNGPIEAPGLSTVDGGGFDLANGPLVRAVLRGRTLTLVIHHLVVDGVSWRILLEDLDTAYRQTVAGEPVNLPPKTTSFKEWALRLQQHTVAGGFDDEIGYWTGVTQGGHRLPCDGTGTNTIASARSVTVRLEPEETRALLQDVPGVYRTQVNDVLLAALGRVLARWTGRDRVLLDLEGHRLEVGQPLRISL